MAEQNTFKILHFWMVWANRIKKNKALLLLLWCDKVMKYESHMSKKHSTTLPLFLAFDWLNHFSHKDLSTYYITPFCQIQTNEWVLLPIVPKICICHSLWWCELLGSMYYTPNLITGLIVMSVYLLGMCFSHALDPGYALFSHPPTHQNTTKIGISLQKYHSRLT